jgi:hypothetical protein
MKKFVGLLSLLVLIYSCDGEVIYPNYTPNEYSGPEGTMRTQFSDDWDDWNIKVGDTTGTLDTQFSNDWDNWQFNFGGVSGDIRTDFSNDWDNWYLSASGGNIDIKTSFSNDFDNWIVNDSQSGRTFTVRTDFSNDWDDWSVYENGSQLVRFNTSFSNDFDNWQALGDFSSLDTRKRVALMFVPIFAGAIHSQGIHE